MHLSKDYETAKIVGSRHEKSVVYQMNAGKIGADGYLFYLSVNVVWLTKEVPVRYLSIFEKVVRQIMNKFLDNRMTIYEYGNPTADVVLIQLVGDHDLHDI